MKFIYPFFNTPSHIYTGNNGISLEYPSNKSFLDKKDFDIIEGAAVVAIRENIGYKSKWSLVKIIDQNLISAEYYDKELYILQDNLINIGGKQTYTASTKKAVQIDESASEINPTLKEIYVPYIDNRNGLYSVRIQVDYEKILDLSLFYKVLDTAFQEGIRVLLASRGYRSDNEAINNILDTYYTFAYVNDDLDLTSRRPCEPITFTISIPTNFFDNSKIDNSQDLDIIPTKFLKFTNKDFVQKIDLLISLLSNRQREVEKALFPNKMFDTFLIEAEQDSIQRFTLATREIMESIDAPIITNNKYISEYNIGLNDDLDIISGNIKVYDDSGYTLIKFNEGILAQLRMRGEFSNKRIINYLLNLEDMIKKTNSMAAIEFIKTYAKYPNVNVIDEYYNQNGLELNADQIGQFRTKFLENSTSCLKISDIQKLVSNEVTSIDLAAQIFTGFTGSKEAEDAYASWCGIDSKSKTYETPTFIQSIKNNKKLLESAQLEAKNEVSASNRFMVFGGVALQGLASSTAGVAAATGQFSQQLLINNLSAAQSDPLAASLHILRRLDAQKTFVKYIYCLLKGQDINNEEVAKFIAQLTPGAMTFLEYIRNASNLKGWRFWNYILNGYSLDIILPFTCNDQFTYSFKFIAQLLNGVNTIIQSAANYNTEITNAIQTYNSSPIKDPFAIIGKSIATTLYNSAVDFAFSSVKSLLDAECDDPRLDEITDFRDPFNTHTPIERFNATENNNQNIIKNNRKNAFQETFPEITQNVTYGYDLEYTVDLLSLLIDDIKCLISPNETIDLLRGEPSDAVVVVIKNLIKNKYSKEPNNLSYLLNDNKLKLFFNNIGNKVDQSILEEAEETSKIIKDITDYSWSDLCKTRDQLPDDIEKYPKELDVLKNDFRNRLEKAKKGLEYLKNPNKVYNISALCPEIEDEEIQSFKNDTIERYKKSISDMFSGVLTNFTQEANSIRNKFVEEKIFIRKEGNEQTGKFIDNFKYETYHFNLGKNLQDIKTTKENLDIFFPQDRLPIDNISISDSLLKQLKISTLGSECETSNTTEDNKFVQFLKEGRVLFENRDYIRNWDNIDKSWKERGGEEGWKSLFSQELESQQLELKKYIKEKKSVIFISREKNTQWPDDKFEYKTDNANLKNYGSSGLIIKNTQDTSFNDYYVSYRHIYYDPAKDDFKQLYVNKYYELADSDLDNDKISKNLNKNYMYINLSYFTGEFIYNYLENIVKDKNEIEKIHKNLYKNIKIFKRINDSDRYNTYVLNEDFVKIKNTKNFTKYTFKNGETINISLNYNKSEILVNNIQQTFINESDTSLNDIKTYEKITLGIEKFKQYGLFNITTSTNNSFKQTSLKSATSTTKYIKTVKVASSDPNTDDLLYVDYFSFSYDLKSYGTFPKYTVPISQAQKFPVLSKIYLKDLIAKELKKYNNNGYIKIVNKPQDLSSEIQFMKDAQPYNTDPFIDAFSNKEVTIIPNAEYYSQNYYAKNYSSFSKLDMNNDLRYQTCNIFPHYLNINYFLDKAGIDGVRKLCDTNLQQIPTELLENILVNITLRTYVTDACVKITPLLSLLDNEGIKNIYKEQILIDIIREYIKTEMNLYTRNMSSATNGTIQQYYENFVNNKVKKVYNSSKENGSNNKLINKYLIDKEDSLTKEIDYFIRKELNHYISFSLDKNIINLASVSILNKLSSEIISKVLSDYARDYPGDYFNNIQKYIENNKKELSDYIDSEFYCLFAYLLAVCTVENNKKSIFSATKAELAKLYFSISSKLGEKQENYNNFTRSQENIVKTILDMAYTADPSLTALAYPDMTKEISFFLENQLYNARNILLTYSMVSDPNIQLTRLINKLISTSAAVSWTLVSPEARKTAIINAAAKNDMLSFFTYKRLESSMVPMPFETSPDFITSLIVTTSGIPVIQPAAIGYLISDITTDIIWGQKIRQEMKDLRNTALEQINKEKCEVVPNELKPPECSSEFNDYLINEINKYEEK